MGLCSIIAKNKILTYEWDSDCKIKIFIIQLDLDCSEKKPFIMKMG